MRSLRAADFLRSRTGLKNMSSFFLNIFSARPCASVREEWVSVRVSRGVAPARCGAILQTCVNMATRKQYSWVRARRDERWIDLARASVRPSNEKW